MKKPLLILFVFFLTQVICIAQNYERVDSIISTYPRKFSNTEKLAKRISINFETDIEKVRAVYSWITNNVAYNPEESGKYNFTYSTNSEFQKKEKKYDKKLSARVISKGEAVCEGYSILFKEVCNKLNIESKIVTGSSKTTIKDIGKRYYSDHAWNIVIINKKEYLVDVTWGAGTYESRFQRNVNYFYFLTSPKLFIKNHYPDNYKNSLLKEQIDKGTFLNLPLIYNHDYQLISPNNGIIKKLINKKVKFTFLISDKVKSISYNIDKKSFTISNFENSDEKLEFTIDLTEIKRARELVLYFDYEPIIGFKIK